MSARRATSRTVGSRAAIYAAMLVILAWTLVPIGWTILSSFKTPGALTDPTPQLAFRPTVANYTEIFSETGGILGYARNSLLAAGISTAIAVCLGCLAGYGLARSRLRGKRHLAFWIISTRMAPIAAVIVPLFLIFRSFGLIDTVTGLVVAYLSFNLPFAIWLMNAFFADLPEVLEESALVDGATKAQAFRLVALPLVKPGLATTAILCFIFAWNDYAFATTFSGPNSETIPIFAAQLVTQTGIDWGALTAIATIVVVPMIVAGLAVKRYLVQGLTLGAVKD